MVPAIDTSGPIDELTGRIYDQAKAAGFDGFAVSLCEPGLLGHAAFETGGMDVCAVRDIECNVIGANMGQILDHLLAPKDDAKEDFIDVGRLKQPALIRLAEFLIRTRARRLEFSRPFSQVGGPVDIAVLCKGCEPMTQQRGL